MHQEGVFNAAAIAGQSEEWHGLTKAYVIAIVVIGVTCGP
jgi:hypothetical protein